MNGRWNRTTYHDRTSWPPSLASDAGVGRSRRSRSQKPTWSRHGPEHDVYDAMRPASRGSVTNSQPWIEPQSCAIRWTGRPGQSASITAAKSSVSFASR